MKLYRESVSDDGDDDEKDSLLPEVKEGESADVKKIKPEQHFTEPPPRYSEASLVKALEEHGIGRPSTYAAIISTIQNRGYVRQEKRRFVPEDVGRIVNKFLTEHFAKYVELGFTAEMEEALDEVSRGERDWQPVLKDFWSPFKAQVEDKLTSVKKSDVTSEKTGETCPECKTGEMIIRLGKFGRFKGCSNYPECKHIENLDGSAPKEKEPPKPTGVDCPKCEGGHIVERKSRRGKIFYGCNQFPKCKYALWNKPVLEPCPNCGNDFITVKELKKGTVKQCPECNWQDPPAAPAKSKTASKSKTKAKSKKA